MAAPGPVERTCESSADKLRDMVAGWIEAVASQGERAMDAFGVRPTSRPWTPFVDVVETDEHVVVTVDLPGVDPQGVEILLTGNMLSLKGQVLAQAETVGQQWHRRERHQGSFSRAIPLPVAVNAEKVSAESRNGILTITLGKEERTKPRHIRVEVRQPPMSVN